MTRLAKIPMFGNAAKAVTVDLGATEGATFGVNLRWPDGRLVTADDFAAPTASGGSSITTTDDLDEGKWHLWFTARRAQDAVGGIVGNSANVTITYAAGTSIVADLTDATVATTGGALKKRSFDVKGRLSAESAATTGDLTEGSNLYYTDARVSYTQSGTGAAARKATAKALELPSPQDYTAAANGVADDTTPIADAIAAQPELRLTGDYMVTSLTNDYGVPLTGQGRILKAITGGNQQLNSRAFDGQYVFGQEYLYALHTKLMAKTAVTMLLSGDSTTEGGAAQATSPYLMHELVQRLGAARGHKITATNGGHSSKDTADWVSTYLTADLATAPDLYVVRWGINDPYYGRSLADFTTSLRAGLAQCRASYTVAQMSILLMVPNSTSDTPNGRDEKWYEQVRKVCLQASRDYQCAFFDTYALWQDSRHAAGLWMDNAFSDGRAIHPLNVMNSWIASRVATLLYPEALDIPTYGTYTPTLTPVANVTSATPSICQWMRVGNVVTVSGRIDVSPTAAAGTFTHVGISLPIASTVSSPLGGAGGAGFNPYVTALISSDTTNQRASFSFYATATGSKACMFTFTYQII